MKITKSASGKKEIRISKKEWQNIGKKAGWYDTGEGHTDEDNSVGNWEGGWLQGNWKCPRCGTMIGKNLKNEMPFYTVQKHKEKCDG